MVVFVRAYPSMAVNNTYGIKVVGDADLRLMQQALPQCQSLIRQCQQAEQVGNPPARPAMMHARTPHTMSRRRITMLTCLLVRIFHCSILSSPPTLLVCLPGCPPRPLPVHIQICAVARNFCSRAILSHFPTPALNPYDIRVNCAFPPLCYDFTPIDEFLAKPDTMQVRTSEPATTTSAHGHDQSVAAADRLLLAAVAACLALAVPLLLVVVRRCTCLRMPPTGSPAPRRSTRCTCGRPSFARPFSLRPVLQLTRPSSPPVLLLLVLQVPL